jgi:epoxide hydrolase-like predicted phosphatase
MTTNEKIRAVIWDLGGVILRTEDLSHREKWERIVFRSEMSQLASVGRASVDDIWNAIQNKLNLDNQDLENLREDFFAGDRIDEELVSFIRNLKGNYKTGMITNAWPDIRHWIVNEWKIADAFDHILISAEAGIVKPETKIYSLSLQALDVQPIEAIFIDDFIENIEGANAVGMHTIHFYDSKDAMKQLRETLAI